MTYDIGELDGRITERLQKVKEILEPAGIPIVTDKLIGIRWTKASGQFHIQWHVSSIGLHLRRRSG